MENPVKITLQKYCIEELTIKAPIPKAQQVQPQLDTKLVNRVQVSKENSNNEFMVSIYSEISFTDLPAYVINCKITGSFKFEGQYSEEEKINLAYSVAPSALFGMLREIVTSLSMKTPYFPIILPVFEFPKYPIDEDAK